MVECDEKKYKYCNKYLFYYLVRIHNPHKFWIWNILDDVFEENEHAIKSDDSDAKHDTVQTSS